MFTILVIQPDGTSFSWAERGETIPDARRICREAAFKLRAMCALFCIVAPIGFITSVPVSLN